MTNLTSLHYLYACVSLHTVCNCCININSLVKYTFFGSLFSSYSYGDLFHTDFLIVHLCPEMKD